MPLPGMVHKSCLSPPSPSPTPTALSSFIVSLKRWSLDQQPQHHLGAYKKYRTSGPTPDLMKQNLLFIKILGWDEVCTLRCEDHQSIAFPPTSCKHRLPRAYVTAEPQQKSSFPSTATTMRKVTHLLGTLISDL